MLDGLLYLLFPCCCKINFPSKDFGHDYLNGSVLGLTFLATLCDYFAAASWQSVGVCFLIISQHGPDAHCEGQGTSQCWWNALVGSVEHGRGVPCRA